MQAEFHTAQHNWKNMKRKRDTTQASFESAEINK